MKPNRVKRMLSEGNFTCGSWVSLCSALGAEVMGLAGFDWLLIDMEHGAGDYQTLLGQLQGIAAAGESVPLVRVQANDPAVIKRVLDLGACGVMVPGVRSAEEARAAVAASKFPPQGQRSLAGVRGGRFGQDAEYYTAANEEIMVVVQVETREAIADIEAICAVPGIDVAFLGPNDLSAALGHVGDWEHPEVLAAVERLEAAARARGLPLGTISRNWDFAKRYLERGYRFQALMGDIPMLISTAKGLVERFREHPDVVGA